MKEGIVTESDLGESSGGRKPKMLQINGDAFYVIGIDAGPGSVDCVLTDLSGNILKRSESYTLTKPLTNDKFLSILIEMVEAMIRSTGGDHGKIIGIGVAMHGVVDVHTGMSLVAPNLDLRNIPIKETLEEHFDLTVQVENDARAIRLGNRGLAVMATSIVWFSKYR